MPITFISFLYSTLLHSHIVDNDWDVVREVEAEKIYCLYSVVREFSFVFT